MKRRVSELEKRVSRLENQTVKEAQLMKSENEEAKKKRRKFVEMSRDFKVKINLILVPSCRLLEILRFRDFFEEPFKA